MCALEALAPCTYSPEPIVGPSTTPSMPLQPHLWPLRGAFKLLATPGPRKAIVLWLKVCVSSLLLLPYHPFFFLNVQQSSTLASKPSCEIPSLGLLPIFFMLL